ncbi:SDR family NAD(P)-dependent oxidoreductase [Brucella sp. 2716]|uniref:SDR family NAD(P)-dependent oxidoreductase n=1 Tax=Brucella sp. 2716 TaxID=2975052 RepID=UPI00217DA3A9|nr:SDR family NAD(P)-dependent oxidoreductase [Brucella sp. 2716]UWF59411.1 SDR family NAD(P)-dependent oxidoreductase [Brucella sp. 2716]
MANLHVITGGAGFIAVNLARRLLDRGHHLLLIDNLSRGQQRYVDSLQGGERVTFLKADLADTSQALEAFERVSPNETVEVWHLCANSDIPAGVNDPSVDLRDTFLTTYEVIRALTRRGVLRLHFSSTSAVYGDHGEIALTEESYVEPISNYGAMKLASEASIRAWCESSGGNANVFRFPNVVGVPATHGVLIDFVNKLQRDMSVLPVLGDGSQRKAYLHVNDLVAAMLFIRDQNLNGYNVFNIGPKDEGITVREIAELTRARVSPDANIIFGCGNRGWVGDVPRFRYSVEKLRQVGWETPNSSHDAIARAIDEIATQEGIRKP